MKIALPVIPSNAEASLDETVQTHAEGRDVPAVLRRRQIDTEVALSRVRGFLEEGHLPHFNGLVR